MAPAPGHLLAPAARRLLKATINKTSNLIRAKLPSSSSASNPILETLPISTKLPLFRQPTHPLAFLKQLRSGAYIHRFAPGNAGRSFFSTIRSQTSSSPQVRLTFQQTSRIGATIAKSPHSRPFASTLRPNLTGGAMPRRAGGYTLGGARQFSSSTGVQADVVRNVAQGVRAMMLGGIGVKCEGVDPVSGERKWRMVGKGEGEVMRKVEGKRGTVRKVDGHVQAQGKEKGTTLRFKLSPTITALSATSPIAISSATQPLQHDFANAIREYVAINNEIKKISTLGDLPIGISHTSTGPVLEVRFPGCDQQTVENLCEELGIWRGVVVEDNDWKGSRDVDMALLFPFAPGCNKGQSIAQKGWDQRDVQYLQADDADSLVSEEDDGDDYNIEVLKQRRQQQYTPGTTTSCFGSDLPSDVDLQVDGFPSSGEYSSGDDRERTLPVASKRSEVGSDGSFEGVEGIFRFLRECDEMRR